MLALSDPVRALLAIGFAILVWRLLWPLVERAGERNADRRTRKFNRRKR